MGQEGAAVGTLIDLGADITTPMPATQEGGARGGAEGGSDIVSQLAAMGISSGAQSSAPGQDQPSDMHVEQGADEFDIFAKSRTAYADTTR